MAREAQSKDIDGHLYEVTMLGGTESWKMLLKLSKMLGPGIGKISGSKGSLNALMDSEIGSNFLAEAIEAFVQNVDEPAAASIIEKLKDVTLVNGKPLRGTFELHFQGDAIGVIKWLIFALQAQYGNFSDALSSVNLSRVEAPLKAQA